MNPTKVYFRGTEKFLSEGQEFESLNRHGEDIAPCSELALMYVTSYMTLFHFNNEFHYKGSLVYWGQRFDLGI